MHREETTLKLDSTHAKAHTSALEQAINYTDMNTIQQQRSLSI